MLAPIGGGLSLKPVKEGATVSCLSTIVTMGSECLQGRRSQSGPATARHGASCRPKTTRVGAGRLSRLAMSVSARRSGGPHDEPPRPTSSGSEKAFSQLRHRLSCLVADQPSGGREPGCTVYGSGSLHVAATRLRGSWRRNPAQLATRAISPQSTRWAAADPKAGLPALAVSVGEASDRRMTSCRPPSMNPIGYSVQPREPWWIRG